MDIIRIGVRMYTVHGKPVWYDSHAIEGMNAERPPVKTSDIEETLKNPERTLKESGSRYRSLKWIGRRTIIVYFDEDEVGIYVRAVSATRKKIA